jgi:1-phosphatidylinositol-4-phosphate 5-kinase
VRQTSTTILPPPRKSSIGASATHSDDPGRRLDETDLIASSSVPTRTPLAADAYLHPSSAATSYPHRPARRNTIGSVVVQLPPRPSRQLTGHKHMPSHPAPEATDLLDSDILEQADQIRRERLSKRAKAQQEAEAALTRAHSKRAVIEEEKVLVGNLIGEDHVNYVLMYNMLTGIRIGVSRCQAKVKRPLTDEDFTARHKFSFDM